MPKAGGCLTLRNRAYDHIYVAVSVQIERPILSALKSFWCDQAKSLSKGKLGWHLLKAKWIMANLELVL